MVAHDVDNKLMDLHDFVAHAYLSPYVLIN